MRTEEQKISQEPIKVTFGGKEFEIKPLPLKLASQWRHKFIDLMKEMSTLSSVTSDDSEAFLKALSQVLTEEPDKLVDLFFEYTGFNREEVENIATSNEMLCAI